MSICDVPPTGWKCSRESGHEGPCAASRDMPYDEYVDRALCVVRIVTEEWESTTCPAVKIDWVHLTPAEFRSLLADAWMAGLSHSLKLIEEVKK